MGLNLLFTSKEPSYKSKLRGLKRAIENINNEIYATEKEEKSLMDAIKKQVLVDKTPLNAKNTCIIKRLKHLVTIRNKYFSILSMYNNIEIQLVQNKALKETESIVKGLDQLNKKIDANKLFNKLPDLLIENQIKIKEVEENLCDAIENIDIEETNEQFLANLSEELKVEKSVIESILT